jgi:ribosomal protein L24E
MRYCDNCGGIAGQKKVFADPRREGRTLEFFYCNEKCEKVLKENLKKKARIVRLVS